MKKLFKSSLVLGVTLLTISGYASNSVSREKKVQVEVIDSKFDEMQRLDLLVFDNDGKIFESEIFVLENIVLKANESISNSKIETNPIISDATVKEEFTPIIVEKMGLVNFSFLNLEQLPTYVKIYDKDDNLVYESEKITDQTIGKIFKVYNFKNETYTFVVTNGKKTFTKIFVR